MNIDKNISRSLNSLVKNHLKNRMDNDELYLLLRNVLNGSYYEPINTSLSNNITGTFATCIYCKNVNYIIKTNIFENNVIHDGTNFWLKYIINIPNNKNLPNLIYYYFYENYYFVIMERLQEVINYIPYIESSNIIDILNKKETFNTDIDYSLLNKNFISKYTPLLLNTIPIFINILKPIVNNYKEITLDICSENIMVRSYKKNIEFILLDPFWREINDTNQSK